MNVLLSEINKAYIIRSDESIMNMLELVEGSYEKKIIIKMSLFKENNVRDYYLGMYLAYININYNKNVGNLIKRLKQIIIKENIDVNDEFYVGFKYYINNYSLIKNDKVFLNTLSFLADKGIEFDEIMKLLEHKYKKLVQQFLENNIRKYDINILMLYMYDYNSKDMNCSMMGNIIKYYDMSINKLRGEIKDGVLLALLDGIILNQV